MSRATLKLTRPITQIELDIDENDLNVNGFVKAVRCKDCLWGKWNQALLDSIYCENIEMDRDPNDYCSRGERREDG